MAFIRPKNRDAPRIFHGFHWPKMRTAMAKNPYPATSALKLVDVGTTNKTKPSDYLNAYHEGETGALMKVHTSNYRILGFTQEVELPEMVELGKKLNLPGFLLFNSRSGY